MSKKLLPNSSVMLLAAVLAGGVVPVLGQTTSSPEFVSLLQSLAPKSQGQQGRSLGAPSPISEAPRISLTANGHLRSLGAPPGFHFVPANGLVAGQPDAVAREFLRERGSMFGIQSPAVDFTIKRLKQGVERNYVRLQQRYQNLPVVAGEVVIQVDAAGGIESVLGDIETDTRQLDGAVISLSPAVTSAQAVAAVTSEFAGQAGGAAVQTTTPVLSLFAPSVLDEPGPQQLVWDLVVFTEDRNLVNERVLWGAVSGKPVRVWTRRHTVLARQVSDANNSTNVPSLVRSEGQGPCGIPDADRIYTFLGDTYNFYSLWHGRDSYNNAGAMLAGISRYCPELTNCPWANASSGPPMRFGAGWTTDDVVAHEFTHNVTDAESGLIYTNASGAINESFSDIWGELVDLANGSGTDTAPVRWWVGEDLPNGAIRNMAFPSATNISLRFNNPDRLFSPLYQSPANTDDNGGVHNNSGVNNKLCYLLTDGDTFNGQTIFANGTIAVEFLYYEAQVNLLTSGAGWTELYNALTQAAVNMGWSTTNRNNLYRACLAVEIATPGRDLYVDNASLCPLPAGAPICTLGVGPYLTVAAGVANASPGDTLRIYTGNYNEPMTVNKILTLQTVNGPVTIGQ